MNHPPSFGDELIKSAQGFGALIAIGGAFGAACATAIVGAKAAAIGTMIGAVALTGFAVCHIAWEQAQRKKGWKLVDVNELDGSDEETDLLSGLA